MHQPYNSGATTAHCKSINDLDELKRGAFVSFFERGVLLDHRDSTQAGLEFVGSHLIDR